MCVIDGGACQVLAPVAQHVGSSVLLLIGRYQWQGSYFVRRVVLAARRIQAGFNAWRAPRSLSCKHQGGLTTRVGGGIGWIVCADCDATLLTSAELPDDWETTKGRLGL